MDYKEIDSEMDKLKIKKVELTNKVNMTTDFEEKEDLRLEIQRIQQQIDTLQKFKKKF